MVENSLILSPKKRKTEFVIFASQVREKTDTIVKDNITIHQLDQYENLEIELDSYLNLNSDLQSICISELAQD